MRATDNVLLAGGRSNEEQQLVGGAVFKLDHDTEMLELLALVGDPLNQSQKHAYEEYIMDQLKVIATTAGMKVIVDNNEQQLPPSSPSQVPFGMLATNAKQELPELVAAFTNPIKWINQSS